MKINNNTRIRINRSIMEELKLPWYDQFHLKIIMRNEYDMILTSSRNYSYYFKPTNPQKCMLFIIQYGHLIKEKAKHVRL